MRLEQLVTAWRAFAGTLEPYAPAVATAYRRAADELEAALREEAAETLNLTEAARESGYSSDALGRMVRRGKIPNAGRPNAPRIRRADLPHKPGAVAKPALVTDFDRVRRRAIASRLT